MRSYVAYVLAIVAILIVIGALGFHAAELEHNDRVDGFGDSLWWALATVTTVGYGDISATTPAGRVVGVLLMFAGLAPWRSRQPPSPRMY